MVALDLALIVSLAFSLAPFVIVARSAGLRDGIVGGLRLLRRNWRPMLALFVCFRIGYEVIAVWDLIPAWREGLLTSRADALLPWGWVSAAASALLGLWVAYAFMDIARQPTEASVHAPTQG